MPPSPTFTERILQRLHLLPTPIMDSFAAVIFARALTVGLRRGMFESLARNARSVEELSRETGLSPEGVRLMAEAFVAGGYLTRKKGAYAAGKETRRWLLRSSDTYLGDLVLYCDSLNRRLGGLEYSLEHGKPREPYYASFSDNDWEIYVRGMGNLAHLLAPEVIRRVRLPGGDARVLDIGGSHALYALACCRKFPGCTAVVMDFAPALRWAAAMHTGGLGDRVSLVAGDFLTCAFPDGLDAVFLFNIIHGFDETTNRGLITHAAGSLRRNGRVYILDQMTGGKRTSLLSQFIPLMVGLNLMNEIGGSSYPVGVIREWCRDAATFNVMPLRFPGVTLIEATDWKGV